MFAAVSLGVFDRLERGSADAATLAAGIHAQTEPLERLLDAYVSLGLLRKNDGGYANERVAVAYLCRSSDLSLTGYVLYSNDVLFPLWTHIENAVREGGHRWNQAFGFEGAIFDHLFQTDEAMRTFLLGMHGFGVLSSPHVVAAFDLGAVSPPHRSGRRDWASGHCCVRALCEPAHSSI
jgi:acetylserotonin N-methyltransferase